MADELMLQIVTPEHVIFNDKVEEVTVPEARESLAFFWDMHRCLVP